MSELLTRDEWVAKTRREYCGHSDHRPLPAGDARTTSELIPCGCGDYIWRRSPNPPAIPEGEEQQ